MPDKSLKAITEAVLIGLGDSCRCWFGGYVEAQGFIIGHNRLSGTIVPWVMHLLYMGIFILSSFLKLGQ